MYDARLIEGAYGDPQRAAASLTQILKTSKYLPGEVAYWLAHARLSTGDVISATSALEIAVDYPETRDRALSLRSQADSLQRVIVSLPYTTDFALGGPFVHSWMHGDRGNIDLLQSEFTYGAALRWTSKIRDRQDDQITATLNSLPISKINVSMRAEDFPAYLRILIIDDLGQEFATDPFTIVTDSWTKVELTLDDFHSTDPTKYRVKPSKKLTALHIHDITTYLSADRGTRYLWLDDLEIY